MAGAEGGGGARELGRTLATASAARLLTYRATPWTRSPPVLRDQVLDVSRVTQTPPDLAATSAVVVVAAVAARRVDVAIGRTHIEPLNLYGATIAESGTRKGPAQRAISSPLRALQAPCAPGRARDSAGTAAPQIAEKHSRS